MRRTSLVACLVLAAAPLALAKDEVPLPTPPTTPLPAFENPLHDAKVGETLRYRVSDLEGGWTRWFEERVLAVKGERVLLETVETNETGEKIFSIDPQRSGWRPAPATIPLPDGTSWKTDKQKEEILYVGEPPKYALRCVRRVRDEPQHFTEPEGRRRDHQYWFSHDVPCSGRVKEWPAQNEGERMAVAWDKVLSPTECEERAKKYKDPEEEKKKKEEEERKKKEEEEKEKKPPEGGMDEPGMGEGEGGMDEPGMGEGGMEGGETPPDPGMGS
jgi:hypothetical protein